MILICLLPFWLKHLRIFLQNFMRAVKPTDFAVAPPVKMAMLAVVPSYTNVEAGEVLSREKGILERATEAVRQAWSEVPFAANAVHSDSGVVMARIKESHEAWRPVPLDAMRDVLKAEVSYPDPRAAPVGDERFKRVGGIIHKLICWSFHWATLTDRLNRWIGW